MKLRCPRCQSRIVVPEEWAGRTIRCRGCNKAFRVPRPTRTIAPTRADAGLDLEDLAQRERSTQELDPRQAAELKRAAPPPAAEPAPSRPTVRVCPHCQKEVTIKDPHVEVLCSNCWEPIPALVRGAEATKEFAATHIRPSRQLDFYGGLASVFTYPFGALASLLAAMLVGIGIILLPVALYVGIARTVEQGSSGLVGAPAPAYLASLRTAVTVSFYLEIVFFAAVGVHAFLETLRTTAVGADKPPSLVWNPAQWGSSMVAYLALLLYYAVVALIGLWIAGHGRVRIPTSAEEFRALLSPEVIGIAAVFTFVVPMHLIGIGVSTILGGLSPVFIFRSIVRTNVHYLFLFFLLATYVTLYVVAFVAVLSWFAGVVGETGRAAGLGNIIEVAGGLVSWGAVMALGFFCTYVLGRIHGLFARTFEKQLAF